MWNFQSLELFLFFFAFSCFCIYFSFVCKYMRTALFQIRRSSSIVYKYTYAIHKAFANFDQPLYEGRTRLYRPEFIIQVGESRGKGASIQIIQIFSDWTSTVIPLSQYLYHNLDSANFNSFKNETKSLELERLGISAFCVKSFCPRLWIFPMKKCELYYITVHCALKVEKQFNTELLAT